MPFAGTGEERMTKNHGGLVLLKQRRMHSQWDSNRVNRVASENEMIEINKQI